MRLEYVPLLKVQRDLYELPRGMERFREYIRTMSDAATGDLKFPLVAMNPMGRTIFLPSSIICLRLMLTEWRHARLRRPTRRWPKSLESTEHASWSPTI